MPKAPRGLDGARTCGARNGVRQAAELLLDEAVEAEAVDVDDEVDVEEAEELELALEPELEEEVPDFAAGELLDDEPRLSLR
jgi:hypothetical protein